MLHAVVQNKGFTRISRDIHEIGIGGDKNKKKYVNL